MMVAAHKMAWLTANLLAGALALVAGAGVQDASGMGGVARVRVLVDPWALQAGAAQTPEAVPHPSPSTAKGWSTRIDEAQRAPNPHGTNDGCDHCHAAKDGAYARPPLETVDATCLGCHDGRRATSEAHPIARPAAGPNLRLPAGWPALDGKLTCLTCHDVLPGCRQEKPLPGARRFLRDIGAARSSEAGLSAFCAACHVPEAHARPNPHRMTAAGERPRAEACAQCHDRSLDVEGGLASMERSGRARLRADEATLCGACHTSHADYFPSGHIGAKATEGVRSALARPVRAGEASRTLADWLPLSAEGTVVCSTCHNPHERGVFPEGSVLARGALETSVDRAGSILRLSRGDFCIACHP